MGSTERLYANRGKRKAGIFLTPRRALFQARHVVAETFASAKESFA